VLVAVASKNDPALASKALDREDLIMARKDLFPIEVNWQPKSQSVARILEAWNISADSVVFVDDSPLELAEVKEAHPEIECFLFPKSDDDAAYELLQRLRGMFGKEMIHADDKIRGQSLRNVRELANDASSAPGTSIDSFLSRLNAELIIDVANDPSDLRAFELINKTNQFNLNGTRLTKADFDARLAMPGAFLLTMSYKDKYGPLGKIAAMLGRVNVKQLEVDSWVMSCRAFSRRIEHKSLEYLFDKFPVEGISFNFRPTERNQPLQEFLAAVLETEPEPSSSLARETFVRNKPELHHAVKELVHA
jgi:FkbH-like protein